MRQVNLPINRMSETSKTESWTDVRNFSSLPKKKDRRISWTPPHQEAFLSFAPLRQFSAHEKKTLKLENLLRYLH